MKKCQVFIIKIKNVKSRLTVTKKIIDLLKSYFTFSRFGPYFVEPVVAGLDPKTFEPFICCMDLIGCISTPEDFCVGGTSSDQLFGMCEVLWQPDLEPDDLFETASQALVNSCDRDAVAGWGAVVHIM